MAKSKPSPKPFIGRWRMISMEELDMNAKEGLAFIEFGADQMGEFRFGLTSGRIDYRVSKRGGQPMAEWTWAGMDEMDPCTGRGWAVVEGDELHGMIYFHCGDESEFVAKRAARRSKGK